MIRVEGFKFGVNYGCNKVRFPSPVKVGSKLRLGATVASVESVGQDAAQVVLDITIETEGSDKPVVRGPGGLPLLLVTVGRWTAPRLTAGDPRWRHAWCRARCRRR